MWSSWPYFDESPEKSSTAVFALRLGIASSHMLTLRNMILDTICLDAILNLPKRGLDFALQLAAYTKLQEQCDRFENQVELHRGAGIGC